MASTSPTMAQRIMPSMVAVVSSISDTQERRRRHSGTRQSSVRVWICGKAGVSGLLIVSDLRSGIVFFRVMADVLACEEHAHRRASGQPQAPPPRLTHIADQPPSEAKT